MRKFLQRLLYYLPIPILIIAINYYVDPANLYNEKYESGIADILVQGKNVTNIINCNDELLQKFYIEKMNDCPSAIALGSSRILLISGAHFKEQKFINNGVRGGASLEDVLAIYYLYEKKGCKIQKIVIGLEPAFLNDNNNQILWKVLQNEYSTILNKIGQFPAVDVSIYPPYRYEKYKELLSISYLKTSLTFFKDGFHKSSYRPTNIDINDGYTRRIDGSVSYNNGWRNAPAKSVEEGVRAQIAINQIKTLGNFENLSEHYKLIFASFVDYLQKQNIEVEFFFAPYHPILYDYFTKNDAYHMVIDAENYFREYANNHNIKVYGSYDPGKFKLDNSDFMDGVHCKVKAIDKIFKIDNQCASSGTGGPEI